MLLIMKQPDLGTALILYLIATTILMVVSLQLHVKLLTLGGELLVGTAFFLFKLHGYQKKRLLTFIDPSLDPSGAGWHARQAIFAVGTRQAGPARAGCTARRTSCNSCPSTGPISPSRCAPRSGASSAARSCSAAICS